MNWKSLVEMEMLNEMIDKSYDSPQVLFKHSTRCSISSLALSRLNFRSVDKDYYILDIIAYREISNKIAKRFNVTHQSPQILLLHKGKCIYDASHLGISGSQVKKKMELIKGAQ